MRVETQRKLFAGVRIDGRMREQLEKCPQRDRVFFESTDGRYLTVLRGGEETYLGKVLDAATPLASIDDVRRNVWSILQRICPGRRDEKEVKLYAVASADTDEEPTLSDRHSGESSPDHGPGHGPGHGHGHGHGPSYGSGTLPGPSSQGHGVGSAKSFGRGRPPGATGATPGATGATGATGDDGDSDDYY